MKALLLAGVCGSLLACFATQDVLGLRRIERQTGDALAAATRDAAGRPPVRNNVLVTSDGAGARDAAAAVSATAEARLADADIGLSASVSAVSDGAFRLNWTLVRGGDRQWCGMVTDTPGPDRALFADFGDRLADAAASSRGHALACE